MLGIFSRHPVGQELEVKLIRDRHRGIVAGYGFIDFRSHEIAKLVLETFNGKPIGELDAEFGQEQVSHRQIPASIPSISDSILRRACFLAPSWCNYLFSTNPIRFSRRLTFCPHDVLSASIQRARPCVTGSTGAPAGSA